MKNSLFIIYLFFFCCVNGQQKLTYSTFDKTQQHSFYFTGYVNKIPLKNIKAEYAIVSTESLNGSMSQVFDLNFDYGQQWNMEKELKLSDEKGKMLIFRSLGHLLNFLDENGWILIDILHGSQFGKTVELVIKRKL